jgi:hypothetical protein
VTLAIWISLIARLGGVIGGKIGALIAVVTDAIGTVDLDIADVKNTVEPWIAWIDAKIAANANLTDAEHQAAVAFADAVRASNASLASGGPELDIPAPPAA